jgi:hypothetical protein
MRALTPGVSSAVDGATSKTCAAGCPSVATAQEITVHATTNAMLCGVWQSRDHSVATGWKSAPIAKEIILSSAAGVRRRSKTPKWGGRAERREQQDGLPQVK